MEDEDEPRVRFTQVGPTHQHDHAHEHGHSHEHEEHSHSHENGGHSHDHHPREHGHTHEQLEHPGLYTARDPPLNARDYKQRAFTVGVGGPVGSGKTALLLALCKYLRDLYGIGVVTNDIFTREDGEFLLRNEALESRRIRTVETGGCPHAAIREDVSANLVALEDLMHTCDPVDMLFVESGGDNLAANFSRELADFIIYVIDVAGGDKIPRKGGPGITQSDLLVINKTDLATAVGADLDIMETQAKQMRQGGPVILAQVKFMKGVPEIAQLILESWAEATGQKIRASS